MFFQGVLHPLLGIDHVLAMVAVGIIAVKIGDRAIWSVPLSFLSAMVVGGVLEMNGIELPLIETSIAISVLLFGAIIAVSKKLPSTIAIACVAMFALFHGHAHALEVATVASPFLYIAGFISTTALLHLTGIMAAIYGQKTNLSLQLLKTSGVAISVAGVTLLLGL